MTVHDTPAVDPEAVQSAATISFLQNTVSNLTNQVATMAGMMAVKTAREEALVREVASLRAALQARINDDEAAKLPEPANT